MLRLSGTKASVATAAALSFSQVALAGDLAGVVRLSGQPLSGAKLTLWRTAGTAEQPGNERGKAQPTIGRGDVGW